ncbi:uncharacterized protein LOC117417948 [Acipenser ruthenus]|uniref:uncharacterized protein LOC117417948 n=1 Tax=Acipenser ruthenus TaxID=7906 RepID=UPI00145A2112|nr:uncharacterized protein LOC117417948 [Acipenser ruthenus]XP_033886271.3 uncharacterized protein LOC117417948 [Acipenser ruthenus]XP_058891399.1 uncharacterized protein LOC117417948 [Acipenser ruthenus]
MDSITVVLLLQLAYRIDKAYAGIDLQPQSLQCTNDYLREMFCTWDAGLKVNCNTNYTLHYQKTAGSKKGACFPHNFRVDPERGGLSAHCFCRFAVPGFDSTDEYEVEICSDGRAVLNSTIRVDETIKTAAPHILSFEEDEDKKVTLLWNSRYSKNESLQELLMFQVMYRKRDNLTEESETIEEPGAVKYKIPWLSLETRNQYIFRVRAKLEVFNATWSDWSPDVIKPKGNLICYNDYIDEMVCVWNASVQINCSGEYTLSFTRLRLPFKNDSCVLRNIGAGPNYLSTHCECKMPKLADEFVISDMYIVEVWHRENAILLSHVFPCETIKPRAPHNLSVSLSENNNFNLTWKRNSNKPFYEKLDFQVSLRKKEEPDEKAQLRNVSGVSLEIIRSSLVPGHSYVVKVRSFSKEYHSQYSDWSPEVEWQNYHMAALDSVNIAIPIVCVSVLVVIISCYHCTRIAKVKLCDKIPNPAKSILTFHSEKSQLLFPASACQETISSLEIEGKPIVKPWVQSLNPNLCEKSAPDFHGFDDYDQTSIFIKQTAGEQHQAVETAPEYQGCPFSCDSDGYYPSSINTYTLTLNRSDEGQPLGFELMQGFQAGAAGSNVKIDTHVGYTSVDNCASMESKSNPADLGIEEQDSPSAGLTVHGRRESHVKDWRGSEESFNSSKSRYKHTSYSWVSVKQEIASHKASSPGLVLNVIPHECPHLNRTGLKSNVSVICCDLSYRTLESLVHEPAPDQSADNATVQQLPNHKSHLTSPVPPAFHTAPVKDSVQLSAPAVMNIYEYQPFKSCVACPIPNQNSRLPTSVSWLGDGLSVTCSGPLNKEAWEPVNSRLPSPGTVEVIDGYQSYDALAGIIQSAFSRAPAAEHRQIKNSTDHGSSADRRVCCDQAYKSVQSLLEMTARELPFIKTMEQAGNGEDKEVDSYPILDFTASNSCVSEYQSVRSTVAEGDASQAPSDPGNPSRPCTRETQETLSENLISTSPSSFSAHTPAHDISKTVSHASHLPCAHEYHSVTNPAKNTAEEHDG